ncbi:metal-dependent transcriptional regulator [Luteibaculum oceani]|uniref:Transcriptional regulator MntR n=1 Tax=Luteibaculum oceani TaxID=1294296 RepID=A0A5C6V9H8_9FLAO|nr:metal-dependent transcriptional regulator [Luteibaculum oceani]TXC82143.1 metal-dependent transcriptional regulator [Luteibaculum oceani]
MTNKIKKDRLTKNEEDYLKAIFYLTAEQQEEKVGTNKLAEFLELSPASVNSMVKKLKGKGFLNYERYGKLELSEDGFKIAVNLIRKHRLWETFLYNHLNFGWDEVHEVAEQLEHIQSEKLMKELDAFLGFPGTDPHGDVIPGADGSYKIPVKKTLSEMTAGAVCKLVSVKDGSVQFLQYLTELGLELSAPIEILEKRDFDGSMSLKVNNKRVNVSKKFTQNIYVI